MSFRFRRSARLGPLRFNYRFAGLRLRQGGLELDLCWWARRLFQRPSEPQRWAAYDCGAAGHRSELERGAQPGSPRCNPGWTCGGSAQQSPAAAGPADGVH